MMDTVPPEIRPEVLIIEDDPQIRRFLRTSLAAEHYRFREAKTAEDGIKEAASRQPDVVLLDLGLPDTDGIEVIRQVRKRKQNFPIIVLSVRSAERDKIAALDAGADDFVNKPFAVGELLALLLVALRRSTGAPCDASAKSFHVGDVEVDFIKRKVTVSGNDIHLTRIEYKLLQVLIRYADRVVTHGQLLNEVWGPHHNDQTHYLLVYMVQLRRKLEADPARPRYLQTEPGVGYR